jgi:predicted esterase
MDRRTILTRRPRFAAICAAALAGLGTPVGAAPAPNAMPDVVFEAYSPLSENAELLRRMLSPLAAHVVDQALARSKKILTAQSIDLSAERFVVHAPPQAPTGGYGVLVFISPNQEAKVPAGWEPILDQYGVIYVSAERSGNAEDVLGRRMPLALLALENIRRRYNLDPDKIYIGGFSGGARVALRVALDYPDVFRGALLNAGSDPIGAPPNHLPAPDLFARFQTASRIVYVTGAADAEVLYRDRDSLQSLDKACVFGGKALVSPATDHEIAKPAALAKALATLGAAAPSDSGRQATCEAALQGEMARQFDHVEALIKAGKRAEAKVLLLRLDGRYGNLARDRILALAQACGCDVVPGL